MPNIRKFGKWHSWVRNTTNLLCTRQFVPRYGRSPFLFLHCSQVYFCCRHVGRVVIAHKSTSAEIGILRKIFQQYDTEGKGHLNYEQFKAAIADSSLQEDDYRRIFDVVVRIV